MIYQGQHVKSRNPVHTGGTEKYGNISGKTPKFLQHARCIRTVTCVFHGYVYIYVDVNHNIGEISEVFWVKYGSLKLVPETFRGNLRNLERFRQPTKPSNLFAQE